MVYKVCLLIVILSSFLFIYSFNGSLNNEFHVIITLFTNILLIFVLFPGG